MRVEGSDWLLAEQGLTKVVAVVITGNAQENAPMIAVNDMLGLEVVAHSTFWTKSPRAR